MSGRSRQLQRKPYGLRYDGREVISVEELDFRFGCRRRLLEPKLQVGFTAYYHWHTAKSSLRGVSYSEHSRRLPLVGEYTGEKRQISLPRSKYRPQGPHSTHLAPVFEITLLTEWASRPKLGEMAIARFCEGSTLFGETVNHAAVQQEIGTAAVENFPPYLGIVLKGSLYYASPVPPAMEDVIPTL